MFPDGTVQTTAFSPVTSAKPTGNTLENADVEALKQSIFNQEKVIDDLQATIQQLQELVNAQQLPINQNQTAHNQIFTTLKDHGIHVKLSNESAREEPEGSNLLHRALALPAEFNLSVNFPNPFNPNTTVQYAIPEAVHVTIEVCNMLGQSVRMLVDEFKNVGYYTTLWDGRNQSGESVASGTYIYKMRAGEFIQAQKMVVAK